jgi:PEP-CTERM motif
MHRVRSLVGAFALLLISSPVFAASILPFASSTIAPNGFAWGSPGADTGHHFHNGMVNAGEMGVEEERGLVEFNLSAESIVTSALLTFDNAPYRTCCVGTTGGSYTIGVFSYAGDNTITPSDYQAVGTLLGWFSTAGLTVGTPFSFDVTTAFNANAGGSLGIRLQALGEPGQTSYTFDNFKVETIVAAVPEPFTMLLLGTGLGGAALRYRRRTTRG